VRVITGKAKGHKLKSPKGLKTRPTSDRIKESVFNIIGDILPDSLVLDLYSGTGSIGIEFLSRGAKLCYFIDNDSLSIKVINENLQKTGLISQAYVYRNDVHNAINILGRKGLSFDYIFMDPPYGKDLVIQTIENIYKLGIIKNKGIIIAEHETELELPIHILGFTKSDSRNYGRTTVTFYKIGEVENDSNLSG
jgi:16S rRNA (guanine(966)-N(2))-methyltransferase RsmD